MKSRDADPGKTKDKNKKSKVKLFSDKSLYANVDSEKSKNYMEGDGTVNGPHLDETAKNADGDTTVNAGVFK